MTIKFYNTLHRRKENFEPLDSKNVRLYACGPTVYDFAHIGNARPAIVFDVVFRLLREIYGETHVTYVRNLTDVDDKIIQAAEAAGEPIEAITTRTARAYHEDVAALNCLPPTIEPRATEHIVEMIVMIEKLVATSHAYEAEGHVLFHVPSMNEYGQLSNRNREDQIAGARVEVAPYKRDPADFVLWKPAAEDEPGWDSPWGRGRPGWHLECSAMSAKHLGVTFDIHGGGQDLIFPHHENEIAQSRCAHDGAAMARYWLHNGYLQMNDEKMSKSLGNILKIRELLAEWPGEVLRFYMLQTHYRQPMEWSETGLRAAKKSLDGLYTSLRKLGDVEEGGSIGCADVLTALEDDLNTPKAIAALHELASAANKAETDVSKAGVKRALLSSGAILGLLQEDPEVFLRGGARKGAKTDRIESLIATRIEAKKQKDFETSDRIRAELAAEGVILEDRPDGSTDWRRA